MSEETYNGWTNRETWAVALHINNDQGWQESVHEAIREDMRTDSEDFWNNVPDNATAARKAGEIIKDLVEEALEDIYTDAEYRRVRDDIGSLWRVNWTELGASFLSDLEELD